MARIRTIKPDFFLDDDVAKLQPLTRILFIALWCLADKAGRLEDKPQRIKIQALPYDKYDVDAELDVLMQSGFIYRYQVDEMKLIEIKSFLKHQRPHNTEKESDLPIYNGEITVKDTLSNGHETTGKEGKGRERKGTQGRFVKPNLEDIKKYCLERKNQISPQTWLDHYESNGWMVGKNPMRDWKAAIRTWEQSNYGGNGNGQKQATGTYRTDIRGHEVLDEAERINAEWRAGKAREAAKEAASSNPGGISGNDDAPDFQGFQSQ
jgi:hypothetical protein